MPKPTVIVRMGEGKAANLGSVLLPKFVVLACKTPIPLNDLQAGLFYRPDSADEWGFLLWHNKHVNRQSRR